MPTLKPLTRDDIEAAGRLSEEAGWNQTAQDWLLMITRGHATGLFEPGGDLVATALVFPFEGRVAWVSMVLVAEARRRQGLATRLLRHGIAYCEQAGMIPMLDATEAGRRVYGPMGFTDLYPISRWQRASSTKTPASYETSTAVRPMMAEDLVDLAAWDYARFGASRASVLQHCWQASPRLAHVAEEAGGALIGYSLGRPGRRATQLGPLVADADAIAQLLIHRALEQTDGPVYIDVPDAQTAFKQTLIDAGFTRQRGFMRMVKGVADPLPPPTATYAIAGPDLG